MLKQNWLVGLAAIIVIIAGGLWWFLNRTDTNGQTVALSLPDGFVMPALSGQAAEGAPLFAANCQACHGPAATGTDNGPPLVHRIYEPGHHGDNAFYGAAANGSPQHHWKFGNMPPVKGVGQAEVTAIIAYVRALQRANGIF